MKAENDVALSEKLHFQEMRAEYAGLLELLELHEIDSATDARKVLEEPLCQAWAAANKRSCGHETCLELLDDRTATFLHDSAAYEATGGVNRVVAAFSVSQERVRLGDLLNRRLEEYRAGTSNPETSSLLHHAFVAFSEGLSRNDLEALTQAAAHILGWDSHPLPSLLERWIASYETLRTPRRKAALLRRAREVLTPRSSTAEPGVEHEAMPPARIDSRSLDSLRSLAARAERDLSPDSRFSLARELAGLVPGVLWELERRLMEDPSEELMRLVGEHLLPLHCVHQPRPRYSKGARYRRRGYRWTTDLGHFIPHSTGGPADINLFHQDRRLNRGWSPQGRAYRFMERYIAEHVGLFHFTRAVYEDETEVPRYLEMGVLLTREQAAGLEAGLEAYAEFHLFFPQRPARGADLAWWIGVFDNQPERVR